MGRSYTARGELYQLTHAGTTIDSRVYDNGGRMTSSTYNNGVSETRAYNTDNTLASISFAGASIGNLTYGWDANKNKTSEAIAGTMSNYGFTVPTNGYDSEDRLVGFNRTSGLTQSWNLSPVGDWNSVTTNGSTETRTHGPTHELLTGAGQNVTTDVKGNITFIPASLRPTASSLSSVFDFDNRLNTADVGNNGSVDVTYKFDAIGRRVFRDDGTTATVYVQAGQQTIADYTAGTAPASPTYRYVYASYIDEPVLRYKPSASESLYYHRNQQYSVVALTNASATIVERYAYSAYGVPTITNAAGTVLPLGSVNNRYMYTGREWDSVLAQYHYRARIYDAYLGRFVSRDPIGFWGGHSLYRNYFQLHGLDPSGKSVVLPDEDDREHFINLLNLLCPDGNFMTGADGNVTSGLGTCLGPSATFPTSCSCIAAAINSPCIIEIKRARRSIGDIIKGIPARPTTVGNCCKDGKVTVYVSEFGGTVLGWPTIPGNYPPLPEPPPPFDDELPGSHPTKRLPDVPLPTPEFIVLAHELCGHAITGWQHPDDPTRYTCEDPVVKLENCVREEHSTPTCDYGVRNGHVW